VGSCHGFAASHITASHRARNAAPPISPDFRLDATIEFFKTYRH
jgi:hypothetical protein